NGDLSSRCDRASDFNIEHYLPVRTVGVAGGAIMCASHGNRADLRRLDFELLKVGVQVTGLVAAAELDDRDALPLAIHGGGVIIEFRHLGRQVRNPLLGTVPRASLLMNRAHMGLSLGTVIETEHA